MMTTRTMLRRTSNYIPVQVMTFHPFSPFPFATLFSLYLNYYGF